jgi:YegS/Rv2252/BmrU family lipid kinase
VKIRVLFNPVSGRRRRGSNAISDIKEIFAGYGIETQVICLRAKWQAADLTEKAVRQGAEMVVVVGGDGTINEAVCGLVGSGIPLGIIPAGSGNGISRQFNIPMELEAACRVIANGRTQSVDVGSLNGRFFLGTAGVGYDAMVGQLFEERWGKQRGMWPYFLSAVSGFFRYRARPLHMCMDDEVVDVVPLLVTAANTAQYGGGAIIAPQAKPNDGLLDVCVIHDVNFFQALYHWPKLFVGRINKMPQWDMYRTRSLEMFSDHPIPVHVDGEPVGCSTHVCINVVPGSLLVRIPRDVIW